MGSRCLFRFICPLSYNSKISHKNTSALASFSVIQFKKMKNDKQAEECIVQAFQELTEIVIPLNSITVPDTVAALLHEQFSSDEASERIYNQINTMIINGKLRLCPNQQNTWDLIDKEL